MGHSLAKRIPLWRDTVVELNPERRLVLEQVVNDNLDMADRRWSHAETFLEKAILREALLDSTSPLKERIETPYPGSQVLRRRDRPLSATSFLSPTFAIQRLI